MTDDLFKVPGIRSAAKPKSVIVRRPGRLGRPARHDPMEAYGKILVAALVGDRAPTNPQLEDGSRAIRKLIDMGKIRVEIYGQNWRVIELMDGPNKGARTAESPKGGKPYRVITATPAGPQ